MKRLILSILIVIPAMVWAQKGIYVKNTVSNLNIPQITWQTTLKLDSNDFHIYRATIKEKKFSEIKTTHYIKPSDGSDTLELIVMDTTLTNKAIYLYYIQVMSDGKSITSVTAMAHNFGFIPSPQLLSFKSTPLTDRKAVKLDWKVSSPQLIRNLTLFRSKSYDTGYIKVGDFAADITTFTDVIPIANEAWFYFIEIHNWFGGVTRSIRTPAFATFAEKPIPPQNMHATIKNDTVYIDWKNVSRNIIGYRVFRSVDDKPFMQLHEMQPGIKEKIVFTDQGKEVNKAIKLSYFIRNVSDGFVESNPTDTITFYMPEHKPVLPPNEVDYITLPDGTLKLLWMPPEKGLVLAYNIYLLDSTGNAAKLNEEPLAQNWYTDSLYRRDGKYTYQVEGVGMNNKISEHRASVTIYRYNPQLHVILDIKRYKEGLTVSWKQPFNPHIQKVMLYKQSGNNKPVLFKSFTDNSDRSVYDSDVQHNNTYQYLLKAEMKNGDTVILNDGVQIAF